jgi:hypothetical protein
MEFKDKYTNDKTNLDVSKTIISSDAYAIGEAIDNLINEIKHFKVRK